MFSVLSCNSELFESDGWRPMLIFPRWAWGDDGGSDDAQWSNDGQWHEIGLVWQWTKEDYFRIPNRAFFSYL